MTVALVIAFLLIAWLAYCLGRYKREIKEVIPEGFVHINYVRDPEHYDMQGNYLWWGY